MTPTFHPSNARPLGDYPHGRVWVPAELTVFVIKTVIFRVCNPWHDFCFLKFKYKPVTVGQERE
jgi:hypothetical protein